MGSCFVIMGFGEKTDFQSNPQRVLNLDSTYENIIKPTVIEAGHSCVRADEIIHSTVIDKPMYDNLLAADLVIADLSTANINAVYELGVRHALRPQRTIVMAESKFSFPFDLNHLSILKYEHLGKDIGFSEVMRVRNILRDKITALMASAEPDSPVFLFIPALRAASVASPLLAAAATLPPPAPSSPPTDEKSFAALRAELLESIRAIKAGIKRAADWARPLELLNRLMRMQPDDPYVLQQLALATYKHEQPDKKASLLEARAILARLAPQTSIDAETVGTWGAIHKRLWEASRNRDDLDEAVRAHARGYYIRNDYHNGINYAFMLDVRAAFSVGDDALADRVVARRARQEVLAICDRLLQDSADPGGDETSWIMATKVEALVGLGRESEASRLQAEMFARERERLGNSEAQAADEQASWNERSFNNQLQELRRLLSS